MPGMQTHIVKGMHTVAVALRPTRAFTEVLSIAQQKRASVVTQPGSVSALGGCRFAKAAKSLSLWD